MPLPSGVLTCVLTFGPYLNASGASTYAGMRGAVRLNQHVYYQPGDLAVAIEPVDFQLNNTGQASVVLPFTDSPGLVPQNFTYTVSWVRRSFLTSPDTKQFSLPQALGSTVSYETLQAAHVPSGPSVPTIVGPLVVSRTPPPAPFAGLVWIDNS